MRDHARGHKHMREPRKRLRGTFLCEVCELACEKVCADTSDFYFLSPYFEFKNAVFCWSISNLLQYNNYFLEYKNQFPSNHEKRP